MNLVVDMRHNGSILEIVDAGPALLATTNSAEFTSTRSSTRRS